MTTALELNTNIESVTQNTQSLKRAVDTLNIIQEGKNDAVTGLAQAITTKISTTGDSVVEGEFNGVKFKIIRQLIDSQFSYDIELLNTDGCSDETLKSLQGLKFTVQEKDEEYKFGAKFGEGTQEFCIGASNEMLPFKSQVSALEGLNKHLILIATATGSGKTITKLMFALAARLSGMKVVSVDPREDLVNQEYGAQEKAVSYNSTTHISRNNQYDESKTHNILSLDRFFAASNKIVNLDKLSKLIKDNNVENEGFKVDLKQKKIIIGKSIEIYQDRYKVNGKEFKESIFNDENLLLIFDEIQDMVNQGQAYHVEVQLLLLLASWKKINLVITTATPPIWVKEFIEKEGGHIEAQSLKQKIASEVGGRIDIAVRKNSKDEQFVQVYVKYNNSQILERSEGEQYYYDHEKDKTADEKQKIRQTVMWNLQSPRNRMTLVCSDSKESTTLLKDKILSPEEQLKTLKDLKKVGEEIKIKKSSGREYNKCDFYQSTNRSSSENIKNKLIHTFGKDKETEINEILKEFDFTSSIAESGVFAVAQGFINNVISCVTGVPLDELSKERLLGHKIPQKDGPPKIVPLLSYFKEVFAGIDSNQINNKISEYISSKLKIEDADKANNIRQGMRIVYDLFVKHKDNNEKLSVLVSNYNLSREIHKMIPPDFSELSNDNIFEIFAQGHDYGLFTYLKDNYGISDIETTTNECDKLYKEYKEKNKAAQDYKRDSVTPAFTRYYNAPKEQQSKLYTEYNKHNDKHKELQKEADDKKRELSIKFKEGVKLLEDAEKYPLSKLRPICSEFAIIEEDTRDECLSDELSQAGLVGYYFNNHRKSGYDNTKLLNVIMRETETDDLKQKKQCVGRPGRKNGPIISSSYVDSSKIGNPDQVQDQLENGSPFESGKATKNKIDPQEFAKRMIEQIEGIISGHYKDGEKAVADKVIECVFATYGDLHNHTEYNNDETYKAWTQTLQNVTFTLKAECEKKNIVIGDSTVKFNIKGIESKIDELFAELSSLSAELDPKRENKNKINERLKIEGNFLKRLIIKLCTLVVHLWHWRLSPTQEQISEVLEKDGPASIKQRVILRKAATQVANEIKPLDQKEKKLKNEESSLTRERIKLQDQYNKMHEYVGVIKRKDGVTQKEITESERDSIIKKQLSGIEKELDKTNRSLSESKKKHDKDLKAFETEDLKGKIGRLSVPLRGL